MKVALFLLSAAVASARNLKSGSEQRKDSQEGGGSAEEEKVTIQANEDYQSHYLVRAHLGVPPTASHKLFAGRSSQLPQQCHPGCPQRCNQWYQEHSRRSLQLRAQVRQED